MGKVRLHETELYAPIKRLLEAQGYDVKAEVGAADVVACRGDDPPLIVELKTSFSLSLFHQAVERQGVSDFVYIAVPHGGGQAFLKALKRSATLCRRLGLGLMTVRLKGCKSKQYDPFSPIVEVHLDPAPYQPRKSKLKAGRLLREFVRRVGDPNTGGATRARLMTAYRQDALRCLSVLHGEGPTKAALVAKLSGVDKARRLMADDHYGWFERVGIGVYGLTPKGIDAVTAYEGELKRLVAVGGMMGPADVGPESSPVG